MINIRNVLCSFRIQNFALIFSFQAQCKIVKLKRKLRLWFCVLKNLLLQQASTTLGIIMSAFTLCWFPFFVLALVRPFMSHQTASLVIPHWLSSLFLWLGYANSFLNPVIYATTNKDFRLPFREILCLRCKSLNSVMREDFYQSQYGNEANKTALALAGGATQLSATAFLWFIFKIPPPAQIT